MALLPSPPRKGARVLGPGDEFGVPLSSDLSPSDPLLDLEEYAKTAPAEIRQIVTSEVGSKTVEETGERTDGKAELLSVRRQDWEAILRCSRYAFKQGSTVLTIQLKTNTAVHLTSTALQVLKRI